MINKLLGKIIGIQILKAMARGKKSFPIADAIGKQMRLVSGIPPYPRGQQIATGQRGNSRKIIRTI